MDALLTDTLVITCDASRRVIEHGAVAVRGERIAAVGPSSDLEQKYAELPRISGRGLATLPGFINAHTHTALTVLRGSIEDFDGDVIYGYMSPVSYTMTGEERAVMVQMGCLEALRSGCATLVDPFRHVPTYGKQMAATGMRLWLSENCADINTLNIRKGDYSEDRPFGQVFLDRTVEMIETLHDTHAGRVKCQIAAHAPDNCSPWMLGQLQTLAQRYGLTRTVHLAQSVQEVKVVREARGGRTPAEYLDAEGWLGPDLVGAHWTFCTEKDIELLASRGVQMVHCPANSSRRGPHRVLIGRIQDAGINIALGTDNMTEDMFHAMKIGLILARGGRGREREGGCDPLPQALLDGITVNAARSVGAEDAIGSHADRPRRAGNATVDQSGLDAGPLRAPGHRAQRDGRRHLSAARAQGARFRRARAAARGAGGDAGGLDTHARRQSRHSAASRRPRLARRVTEAIYVTRTDLP